MCGVPGVSIESSGVWIVEEECSFGELLWVEWSIFWVLAITLVPGLHC